MTDAGESGRPITLVHLERSRSERILWSLEELGLPYRLKRYHRRPDVFAPDDLKGIHALGNPWHPSRIDVAEHADGRAVGLLHMAP